MTAGTSALRVYLPTECDSNGLPLDWYQCHSCRPGGRCEICGGHGSVHAAALELVRKRFSDAEFVRRLPAFDGGRLPTDKDSAMQQIEARVDEIQRVAKEVRATAVVMCEECGAGDPIVGSVSWPHDMRTEHVRALCPSCWSNHREDRRLWGEHMALCEREAELRRRAEG